MFKLIKLLSEVCPFFSLTGSSLAICVMSWGHLWGPVWTSLSVWSRSPSAKHSRHSSSKCECTWCRVYFSTGWRVIFHPLDIWNLHFHLLVQNPTRCSHVCCVCVCVCVHAVRTPTWCLSQTTAPPQCTYCWRRPALLSWTSPLVCGVRKALLHYTRLSTTECSGVSS